MRRDMSGKDKDKIRARLDAQRCPEDVIQRVLVAEAAVDTRLPIADGRVAEWERLAKGHYPVRLYFGPQRTMKEIPAGSDLLPYPSRLIVHRGVEYQLNPRYNGS